MTSKYPHDDNSQHNQRFLDIDRETYRKLMPIQGYAKKPLVSLEEAVESIVQFVPDIKQMAYLAKMKCENPPADNLSIDESAAIILYTMEWAPQENCLYHVLNKTLRAENRNKLIPWFSYLKLILTGFSRLPSSRRFVYRRIKCDLRNDYKEGGMIIWWGFSSCISTMDVLENDQFLGLSGTRTLFSIECNNGKDIKQHSSMKNEDEILLPPGRLFKIVSCRYQSGDLCMIQLKEIESPYPLLEPVSKRLVSIPTTVEKDVELKELVSGKADEVKNKANESTADSKQKDQEVQHDGEQKTGDLNEKASKTVDQATNRSNDLLADAEVKGNEVAPPEPKKVERFQHSFTT